ncbi:putative nuclease HARBI1 [Heterodontus francisci]|uniref:putative nuclease HARBI1 n=1 Tax=Heterodontus francisci TaxID=7792 RepID=UPI00355B73D1
MVQDEQRHMGVGGHPMPVVLKAAMVLNLYASASFQGSTADLCGISQSAAHWCNKEVTNVMFKRARDYVHYRTNLESQMERSIGATARFPQVHDVIHAAIKTPTPASSLHQQEEHPLAQCPTVSTWRRKHNTQFLGRSHDAYLLWQYQVPQLLRTPVRLQALILGDKGYLLRTWDEPTQGCRGDIHGLTLSDHRAGHWSLKMQLSCLDRSGGAFQYAPARVLRIVVVCCVLQKLALQRGVVLNSEDIVDRDASSKDEDIEEPTD